MATGTTQSKAQNMPAEISQTLAHHEAAIATLGGRMTGVETGLRTLQTEVHSGFAQLSTTLHSLDSKVDRFDARPVVDVHKTVSTVTTLAVLFSMVVGGIIWVTTSQFAPIVQSVSDHGERLTRAESDLIEAKEKLGWVSRVDAVRAGAKK